MPILVNSLAPLSQPLRYIKSFIHLNYINRQNITLKASNQKKSKSEKKKDEIYPGKHILAITNFGREINDLGLQYSLEIEKSLIFSASITFVVLGRHSMNNAPRFKEQN